MIQLTISWQPGSFKGMTVAQTDQLIMGGCQIWQQQTGVRFYVVRFGVPSTITVYPWHQPMPGVMVAYTATRQILYTTLVKLEPVWARMAIAHELGHCFGWGHSPTNKPEDLMHPKGSSVYYFAAAEARRARAQFGQPNPKYPPESILFLNTEIKRLQGELKKAPANGKAAIQTQINDRIKQRDRIRAEWRAIGDPINVAQPTEHGVSECFSSGLTNVSTNVSTDYWRSIFSSLRQNELKQLETV